MFSVSRTHPHLRFLLALALLLTLPVAACGGASASLDEGQATTPPPPASDPLITGMKVLHGFYIPSTGLYSTTGWWNSGNGITILADYEALHGDTTYEADIANTFSLNKAGGFLNKFYDDEGWWALAWIAAFDRTQKSEYLTMAESIFNDMQGGWDATCGGGIWWSKDRNYKNAIPNELFLSVAAALALREKGEPAQTHRNWASKEWSWFLGSGMINAQHLVNDGLTAACTNNGQPTYTYNQGVLLGGAVSLAKLQGDPGILAQAATIATAAITRLTDANGVLHEVCEPQCGDGAQFKGIFVRNLQALQAAAPSPAYRSFLRTNALSVQAKDSLNGQMGLVWSGPFSDTGASAHMAGLDLLIAEEASRQM